MARRLTVRVDIAPVELDQAYQLAKSDNERTRVKAVQLLQTGGTTAGTIAKQLGVSRAQLFTWKRLYNEGGLKKLLARGHGGGRPPRLNSSVLAECRKLLHQGKSPAEIQYWLNGTRKISIKTGAVYYWLRKVGFESSRAETSVANRGVKPARSNALAVHMDELTEKKVSYVFKYLPELSICTMLEALVRLAQRTELLAKAKADQSQTDVATQFELCSIEAILDEFHCSRASLYRWAEKWQAANMKWDTFVSAHCSKTTQKKISALFSVLAQRGFLMV